MLAGTKPSKVAVRLSLTDWLLVVVLLGTGASVSVLDRCYYGRHYGICKSVDQRGRGSVAGILS